MFFRDIFIDPETDSTYKEGQFVKRLRLARTLEIIAEEGADALYNANGTLINGFVKDVQAKGGIITAEDMSNYEYVYFILNTTNANCEQYTKFSDC